MTDEFLIRLDEEFPSDEKYAVKLIETQVLSRGYREKIELLIDKVDKLSATANIDILHEIKDVLSGMLDSLNGINKKYAFISELLLKLDEKVESRPAGDMDEVNNRLRTLSEGLASLLADLQIAIERKHDILSESVAKAQADIENVQASLDEIKAKQEGTYESLNELQSNMPDAQSIHDKLDIVQLNQANILPMLDAMNEAASELKSGISSLKSSQGKTDDRVTELGEKLDDIRLSAPDTSAIDRVREKLDELEVAVGRAYGKETHVSADLERLDEKINSISVGIAESMDKLDEKLNQVYSEIDEKIARLLEKTDMVSRLVAEKPGEEAVERLAKNQADELEDLKSKIDELKIRAEEKAGEAAVAAAEAAAKTEEKLNDIYASSSHNLEKLESKVGEMSVAIAEVAAKLDVESPVELDDLKKEHERVANSVRALQDDIESIRSQMKAYSEEILAALAKKPAARRRKRKKAGKARRVRRRAARKRRRVRAIVDNETLDTVIVNTLNTASMNIAQLRETTKISEAKLRERLNVLMARGVVVRERRGRSIFYVSKAEQPMPAG